MVLKSMREECKDEEETYEAAIEMMEVELYEINGELIKLAFADDLEFETFSLESM